jgi:plastocyanin
MFVSLCRNAVLFMASVLATSVCAGMLQVSVVDPQGAPLADAVVTLAGPPGATSGPLKADMDQRDKVFYPHVLAVRAGTSVTFPNSDDIRHQVYSFSSSKRFELRLYQGTPAAPILFDQPGVVVLGCNIHDWMLGYIYVTQDPWYGVSDEKGHLTFDNLPDGAYTLTLWHPQRPDLQPQPGGTLTMSRAPESKVLTLAVAPVASEALVPPTSPFGDAFGKALREDKE